LTDNEYSQNYTEIYSSSRDIEYVSETELSEGIEINEERLIPRRSHSLSIFDFITETMTARDLQIQRRNSFTNMDVARKQADGMLSR